MTQTRKRYDKQFKISAAKVVLEGERTVSQLSDELGIKDSTPGRWAKDHDGLGGAAFPGNGPPKANEDHEMVKLRRQVEELGTENGLRKDFRALSGQSRA